MSALKCVPKLTPSMRIRLPRIPATQRDHQVGSNRSSHPYVKLQKDGITREGACARAGVLPIGEPQEGNQDSQSAEIQT